MRPYCTSRPSPFRSLRNLFILATLGFCRFRSHDDYRQLQKFIAEENVYELEQKGIKFSQLRVLELASGAGGYSIVLNELAGSFTASDLYKNEFFNKSDIHFQTINALEKFPFEANSFDLIYCSSLIEHLCEPTNMIKESWRVLSSGGHLYLSFPPFYSLAMIGGHQFKPFHFLGENLSIKLTNRFKNLKIKSYATCDGSFGLHPLTIDQVKKMILACNFNIKDTFTRMSPINTACLPGVLKDLLTWHVCFLCQKFQTKPSF